MSELLKQDSHARQSALNPNKSFIVQAPAGSGKTELLTQRYLVLLKHAKRAPEEILAVTFTRKAQAEMRQRIIDALKLAQNDKPEQPHKQLTWSLGKEVLAHSDALGWDILNNPNRLRIMTIDALAHYLVSRMPILSQFGGQLELSIHPEPLYRQAVSQFLMMTQLDEDHKRYLSDLLWHLDNRLELLESLLIQLLTKRDQWLIHVYPFNQNPSEGLTYLEQSIERAITESLNKAHECLLDESEAIESFLAYINPHQNQLHDKLKPLADMSGLPEPQAEALAGWRTLAAWLLTDKGEIRKKVTKAQGFVAPSSLKQSSDKELAKQTKQAFEQLLARLQSSDAQKVLASILLLPDYKLNDEHQVVLSALFELLPLIVAHLKVVFKDAGEVDFIEIAQAAIAALGDEDNPTDLALSLDYQFNHILIDEFQDTSVIQFELFEKILRGWTANDGRSLFLVGDPQQSIYRFRGAEVGLFLRAKEQGIANIDLNFLQLRRNFRSQKKVVDWCNQSFSHVFPKHADISLGAVPFSLSLADEHHQGEVELYCFEDSLQEANYIARYLEKADKDLSKVILVRARSHLVELTKALRAMNISFIATDLEPLTSNVVIMDLMSLTKAWICHADRLAWVSVLRAPLCGLSLEDLWQLAQDKHHPIILSNLQNEAIVSLCSTEGQQKIARVSQIFKTFLAQDQRSLMSHTIKALWLQLGGATCYQNLSYNSVDAYFHSLDQYLHKGPITNWDDFEQYIANQFSEPDQTGEKASVELMTIHKAKGLEFDVVIMPSLEKKPRARESELLLWQERPFDTGVDLLMAPAKGAELKDDKLYHYLSAHIQQKDFLESGRLLYVGATRAKQTLMLTSVYPVNEDKPKLPAKTSFLGLLFGTIQAQIHRPSNMQAHSELMQNKFHLSPDWRLPDDLLRPVEIQEGDDLNWAQLDLSYEAAVGTCVHKIFEIIAREGVEHWVTKDLTSYHGTWSHYLTRLQVASNQLEQALALVHESVENTLSDEKGLWILSQHPHSDCELKINKWFQGKMQISVLDRMIVEPSGLRWVIDYKVVQKQPNVDDYQAQIQHYANLLRKIHSEPVALGLYFPLQKKWWEQRPS